MNTIKPIIIDGSHGEGGGQILRTSIGLALCTGKPVTIINIRANRKKPGLLRQHLTCVKAAVEISNGSIEGDQLSSQTITFYPGTVKAGNYHFSIGSAGSTVLVLQTILPALMLANDVSNIQLEGGTHNPMAPSLDFLNHCYFPILKKMGITAISKLDVYGFYPAGGGKWNITISPVKKLKPVTILEREGEISTKAIALTVNLAHSIGAREIKLVQENMLWPEKDLKVVQATNSPGAGNILSLYIKSKNITQVITAFGERGTSAEKVAKKAIKAAKHYIESNAPVGEHLADQLLIPFALAGSGRFVTSKPSLHTQTNLNVIQKLLDVNIKTKKITQTLYEISIHSELKTLDSG